jgi:hypothetical protein
MFSADAGDAISANRTAAPRNLILVIGPLLIIDPRTSKWIVREQDRHRGGGIPSSPSRFGDRDFTPYARM